jgi:hypothetical protein
MKILLQLSILLVITSAQALCQNKQHSDSSKSGFKYLKLDYNNHFGTGYSLTIDSIGNIIYRTSPEITTDNKIVTRVTGNFSKKGFGKFLNKLTDSLILRLAERKNGCGIDEATKDFKLKIGSEEIFSEGCSLESELKLFFEYLDKLPASKDFVNRKKG